MERELSVIPECYVDTNLMNSLLGKSCNHQKGCPTVLKIMEERFRDSFAVGVIDRDKRQPKAMEKFDCIANNESLYVYKHKSCHHYILQVAPAEEVFIQNAAAELNINLAEFGIPDDLAGLKQFTKSVDAKDNGTLRALFSVLQESVNVKIMKSILLYLLENKYSVDIDRVKELIKGL